MKDKSVMTLVTTHMSAQQPVLMVHWPALWRTRLGQWQKQLAPIGANKVGDSGLTEALPIDPLCRESPVGAVPVANSRVVVQTQVAVMRDRVVLSVGPNDLFKHRLIVTLLGFW